jgi:hypothetical protein
MTSRLPSRRASPQRRFRNVKATQLGKKDRRDEGTGSPDMGLIQTNSEVFGGSVKVSVMADIFGTKWRRNGKRLGAMSSVLFLDRKRMVRVPLVDMGPATMLPRMRKSI